MKVLCTGLNLFIRHLMTASTASTKWYSICYQIMSIFNTECYKRWKHCLLLK